MKNPNYDAGSATRASLSLSLSLSLSNLHWILHIYDGMHFLRLPRYPSRINDALITMPHLSVQAQISPTMSA